MKKILSLFLTVIIVYTMCMPAIAVDNISFNSWSDNNKYAGAEETATLASKLNRANLSYIITEAFDIDTKYSIEIKDVPKDYWAYNYICAVVSKGIMTLDNGRFFPEEYVAREEIPQYFKFLNISYPEIGKLDFQDLNTVSDEYSDLFKRYVTAGYLMPVSDKYLLPKRIITITETITMLNKMFPNVENKVLKDSTYEGHFLLRGSNTYLSNINIAGDLVITEGIINENKDYINNEVTLEDVNVGGNIYILGGSLLGKFSFKNIKADNIIVLGEDPIIISFSDCNFNSIDLGKSLGNIVTDKNIIITRN